MSDDRYLAIRDAVYLNGDVTREMMKYLCEKIAELESRLKKAPAHYVMDVRAVRDGLDYDRV